MHYFQFNIGEYASHTRHLSPIEDLAYRRLLDLAYTTELPITKDIRHLTRLINLRDYATEVQDVLSEFFLEVDDGWINNRVIKEIAKTGRKSQAARNSAAKRWDMERKQIHDESMRTHSDGNANASVNDANEPKNDATNNPLPITNNPLPKEKPKAPVSAKRTAIGIDAWLDGLGESEAIPATDPIFDYADKAGIPIGYLELSWKRFVEDMRDRGTRKKDWRAHYRNAVKSNWFKLWWFDSHGDCKLTTTGEQARRAAA